MNSLLLAIGFLTSIPISAAPPRAGDLGRAAVWFPWIGFCLGGALAAAHIASLQVFPPLVAATLTVALWALVTGGLHLDGLADSCDGLLAPATPERRLAMMRDPHVGAFGVAGLIIHLMLKVALVAVLPAASAVIPLTLAASVSRWVIVLVAQQPAARPDGMAANFALGLTRGVLLLAALLPLAWLIIGVVFSLQIIIALMLAHLAAFALAGLAHLRLGGITGDVLGLVVEASEVVMLLVFAAIIPIA